LTSFIITCVNNQIFPLTQNVNETIQHEIQQIKQMSQRIDMSITEVLDRREIAFKTHRQSNQQLEHLVLDYLKRVGQANEYVIAQDLGYDAASIYHICSNLYTQKLIKASRDGKWIYD